MFVEKGAEFNCPACNQPFGGPPEKYAGAEGGIAKCECQSCHQVIKILPCCDDRFGVFDKLFLPHNGSVPQGIGSGKAKRN